MTDTPSEAAKRKACELANAQGCRWAPDEPTPQLYALALYIDGVSEAVKSAINACGHDAIRKAQIRGSLARFMLPDPVDPLEEILGRVTAKQLRAELDKRGLTIAPKEQGRLTDAK